MFLITKTYYDYNGRTSKRCCSLCYQNPLLVVKCRDGLQSLMYALICPQVSDAMRNTDFVNNASWGKTLVRCHQLLLEAIDRINEMTLLPNFALTNCNFVVCLIVLYSMLTENLIPPMIIAFSVTLTGMTGLGLLSEALIQVSPKLL